MSMARLHETKGLSGSVISCEYLEKNTGVEQMKVTIYSVLLPPAEWLGLVNWRFSSLFSF